MKVWIVTDCDYDNTWIVAAYPTEAMANEHVSRMGGNVEETEILDTLHPDVIDPIKQAERDAEAAKSREQWERQRQQQECDAKARAEVRPHPRMGLCHCETFSKDRNFVNAHGYCGYCGGFTPEVFRQHLGEDALQAAIDKLAIHDREKMRAIVAV